MLYNITDTIKPKISNICTTTIINVYFNKHTINYRTVFLTFINIYNIERRCEKMRKRTKNQVIQQVFPFWNEIQQPKILLLSNVNTDYELQQSKEHWKNNQNSKPTL